MVGRPAALPGHEAPVEVGDRGTAHTDQAGRGEAGGVALLADDHDGSIGILGLGDAVGAAGVEAPFQVVALDDQRPGNLAELGPLGRRPDVDQQAAVVSDLLGLVRVHPAQAEARLGQQAVDCAQGAQVGSARYSARSTTRPWGSWR